MPNLHTYLHPGVKGMLNRHLPPLLRFIPQFAQICIIFVLSKFEANPFFRPVNKIIKLPKYLTCGHSSYIIPLIETIPYLSHARSRNFVSMRDIVFCSRQLRAKILSNYWP